MPVYEYDCAGCGPFEALRPMAESALPMDCPDCGRSAPRVILTAPGVATTDAGRRGAEAPAAPAAHMGGCACCVPRARATDLTGSAAPQRPRRSWAS